MKRLMLCLTLCASFSASAEIMSITDTQITRVYTQSRIDSTAHLIAPNKAVDPSCGGRLYIDLNDKELFATALAKHMAGMPVDILYLPGGGDRLAAGHAYVHCRVISIY